VRHDLAVDTLKKTPDDLPASGGHFTSRRDPWFVLALTLFALVELTSAWEHTIAGMLGGLLVFGIVETWKRYVYRRRASVTRRESSRK